MIFPLVHHAQYTRKKGGKSLKKKDKGKKRNLKILVIYTISSTKGYLSLLNCAEESVPETLKKMGSK